MVMPVEIMLMCQLSAGVGTSRASRRDHHHPSFGQLRARVSAHRDSQTLYVSDVIEPPTCANPGYGKLHVGIYFASIRDTIDRQKTAACYVPTKTPWR